MRKTRCPTWLCDRAICTATGRDTCEVKVVVLAVSVLEGNQNGSLEAVEKEGTVLKGGTGNHVLLKFLLFVLLVRYLRYLRPISVKKKHEKMAPSGCICGIIGMRFAVPEVGVPVEGIGRAIEASQVLEMMNHGWSTWARPPPNVPP